MGEAETGRQKRMKQKGQMTSDLIEKANILIVEIHSKCCWLDDASVSL